MKPDWERFSRAMMKGWPEPWCLIADGFDVQKLAHECGVLQAETRTELCSDECQCDPPLDGQPWICYRLVE